MFLTFWTPGRAQTLVDLGATAPTPGANDISQFSTAGDQTFPDNLNYYTDNQTGHGGGEPGQTFTTGTNSAGYVLSSVALLTAGLGSFNNVATLQPGLSPDEGTIGYWIVLASEKGAATGIIQWPL